MREIFLGFMVALILALPMAAAASAKEKDHLDKHSEKAHDAKLPQGRHASRTDASQVGTVALSVPGTVEPNLESDPTQPVLRTPTRTPTTSTTRAAPHAILQQEVLATGTAPTPAPSVPTAPPTSMDAIVPAEGQDVAPLLTAAQRDGIQWDIWIPLGALLVGLGWTAWRRTQPRQAPPASPTPNGETRSDARARRPEPNLFDPWVNYELGLDLLRQGDAPRAVGHLAFAFRHEPACVLACLEDPECAPLLEDPHMRELLERVRREQQRRVWAGYA